MMFKLSENQILEVDELLETGEKTLVDRLLAEQKSLTAVERFSQKHEDVDSPLLEPHYKDLIAIRKPSTGEQYAFSVDLDKCTGCKGCVVACHSRNGLDEDESWRDVGTIHSLESGALQTVTSACHHCMDPACMNGCPVGAYEKMPDTGIVRHLDDQCIGCQYCSLKCPYDVPKYNQDLGIVRKCDMCHERLAEGEAPACVQACPNGAIKIEVVSQQSVIERIHETDQMIAGAYDSDYTKPTTRFHSSGELATDMVAVDNESIEASHKHTPLSWMLVLTQLSVGVLIAEAICRWGIAEWSIEASLALLILSVLLGLIGLLASVFHLGSPFGAWRVFLGLRTSWLSREVMLFGAWMPALKGYLALILLEKYSDLLPSWVPSIEPYMINLAGVTAILLGVISVYCSVMVYADTHREFWTFRKTFGRFGGSVLLGAGSGIVVVSNVVYGEVSSLMWMILGLAVLFKLVVESLSLLPLRQEEWSSAKKSALIQWKTLRSSLVGRWALLALGLIGLLFSHGNIPVSCLAFTCLIIAEWLERQLFFQAVETLKMPGS